MISHSNDRGATWSKPKGVDPPASASTSQFQQMIAVNSEGVLGVFFYSTEGFPARDQFDVYFTASLDGGETFQPKARVSSETSRPLGQGNLRPGPFVSRDRGMVVINTISGIGRWPDGGDYIGMTADSDGAFHPFWTDGRSGTYHSIPARSGSRPGLPRRRPLSRRRRLPTALRSNSIRSSTTWKSAKCFFPCA